jgi:hypothetical protein
VQFNTILPTFLLLHIIIIGFSESISSKNVDGVKGSHYFSSISSFSITDHFDWDWFHCLGNLMIQTLNLWKGIKPFKNPTSGLAGLCKALRSHPVLWDTSGEK